MGFASLRLGCEAIHEVNKHFSWNLEEGRKATGLMRSAKEKDLIPFGEVPASKEDVLYQFNHSDITVEEELASLS